MVDSGGGDKKRRRKNTESPNLILKDIYWEPSTYWIVFKLVGATLLRQVQRSFEVLDLVFQENRREIVNVIDLLDSEYINIF